MCFYGADKVVVHYDTQGFNEEAGPAISIYTVRRAEGGTGRKSIIVVNDSLGGPRKVAPWGTAESRLLIDVAV